MFSDPRIATVATVILALAVLHTFLCAPIRALGNKYPEGSPKENFFHLIGEVEIVFGLWAAVFLVCASVLSSPDEAIAYAESRNFTEPFFVLAIMATAATRPIISVAASLVDGFARLLPFPAALRGYVSCLLIGPLLGSFITEPAAMTLTALLIRHRYFPGASQKLKYVTLAVLFVNVSIGGALTSYAAPPVLMVAAKWGWNTPFMLQHFGWKVLIAVCVNAIAAAFLFRQELSSSAARSAENSGQTLPGSPVWLTFTHLLALALIVVTAHHPVIFLGVFLFFLGIYEISREHQDELQLRSALLVAFFLGGIVILGGMQSWWIQPLFQGISDGTLFVGATALTAITDNAALTYLGSQVENVTAGFQYALVAGAIAGGGLTVIANAPNPAGFTLLQGSFGSEGIHPIKLLAYATPPTLVAMACLWLI